MAKIYLKKETEEYSNLCYDINGRECYFHKLKKRKCPRDDKGFLICANKNKIVFIEVKRY